MFILGVWFPIFFWYSFWQHKDDKWGPNLYCSQTHTHPWWSTRMKKQMNIWY